jgi:hypothetical protein
MIGVWNFFWLSLFSSFLLPVKCFAPLSLLHGHKTPIKSHVRSNANSNDGSSFLSEFKALQDRASNLFILERLLGDAVSETDSSSSLIELSFLGQGTIGNRNDKDKEEIATCLFASHKSHASSVLDALPIPLAQSQASRTLRLLRFAYLNQPISKSLCLTLSPLLINRDGTLYDNLPWSTWSIDPNVENRDAANNPVEEKYHLGKRNAYNRFMGRDWFGRSVSVGNLAARASYFLQNSNEEEEKMDDGNSAKMNESATAVLAKRVLELEVKEANMACAEAEEQLALVRVEVSERSGNDILSLTDDQLIQNYETLQEALTRVEEAQANLEKAENLLEELTQPSSVESDERNHEIKSMLTQFLDSIIASNEQNPAPYRGAIGYNPTIDTPEEMFQKSILPYSSPFQLMQEIIEDQLNAQVIGCGLENMSLFPGSVVLGGVLVLRRKGRKKSITLAGEDVEFEDNDDDFGNIGVEGGTTFIVECECDEAIGMALTCDVPIVVQERLWKQNRIDVKNITVEIPDVGELYNSIPQFCVVDQKTRIETQGDGIPSTGTAIQTPRDVSAMPNFSASRKGYNEAVFNTNNPIQSLDQYDELTNSDKAQLLLSLQSFVGRLPRPRQLTQSTNEDATESLNALDEALIPLIDESVRRQVLMREAKNSGEEDGVARLEESKSLRQMAKERSMLAKAKGDEDMVQFWDTEAELYSSLRADVTQDEGSYSAFLDRDEWYERDRQAVAKRLDKKKFGTLLDGIE